MAEINVNWARTYIASVPSPVKEVGNRMSVSNRKELGQFHIRWRALTNIPCVSKAVIFEDILLSGFVGCAAFSRFGGHLV